MPAYRLKFAVNQVPDARCFKANTGLDAAERARQILADTHGDHAELSFDDGTGQYIPYKTIGGSR